MPTVTENTTRAFAHCPSVRCPGSNQMEVDAVEVTTGFTVGDLGGDQNTAFTHLIERSMVSYRFANDDDVACPACGRPRELTGQARPSYDNLSGFDPNGLVGGAKFDPSFVSTPDEQMKAELKAELRKELLAELKEKQE